MLPYFPHSFVAIGGWEIHAYPVCALAALLAARWIILRRALRFGVPYEEIAPLYLTVIVAGVVGAVTAGLLATGHGIESIGAVAGGLAGGTGYCWVQRLSWQRSALLLDVAAYAAPFAGAIGRLGCTLAHDHRGLPSEGWFAFRFPEGGRYDLGFVDFLYLCALSAFFVLLDRRPRPLLWFLGSAAAAYGAFRIWRETLDVTPNFVPWAALCAIGIAALALGKATQVRDGVMSTTEIAPVPGE